MSICLPSRILEQAQGEPIRHVISVSGGKRLDMLAYAAPPTSEVCIYAGGLCE